MTTTPKNHWRVIVFALTGLTLVTGGLVLAALSNPKRFTLDVANDRYIQFFAISGLACTLTGVLLFLYAVRDTTKSMPAKLQTNANVGMGLGFVLQLAGFFLPEVIQVPFETGLALILAGFPAFIWGGIHYAQGKGHPRLIGSVAMLGILGLVVLILLPYREFDVSREGT